MQKTTVINLYCGPGGGKSTLAAGLFYLMKKAGKSCELVTEFAKELTWAQRHNDLQCQFYVSGTQYHRVQSLVGKVNYIITDSPLLLGIIYTPDFYPDSFKDTLYQLWSQQNNINFFVNRHKEFNPEGRNHNEEESKDIDEKILTMLDGYNIDYKKVDGIEKLRLEMGV